MSKYDFDIISYCLFTGGTDEDMMLGILVQICVCSFIVIKLESMVLQDFNQIQRNQLNASQVCAYRLLR